MSKRLLIGTAGWGLPRAVADRFPPGDSQLARYAGLLSAVEINSSFYRSHQRKTYERWTSTVGEAFRFSVKLPKTITHEHRLVGADDLRDRFLGEVAGLGARLGPILIQLPPSLSFDPDVAFAFFGQLRDGFDGLLACEPRHSSWFTDAAAQMLEEFHIVRVAADPALVPEAAVSGGWRGFSYRRLHGAPKTYYSNYSDAVLEALAVARCTPGERENGWCIFDNTALGNATANALTLLDLVTAAREDV